MNLLSGRTLNARLQKMVTTIGRRRKAGLKHINQVRGIEKLYYKWKDVVFKMWIHK